MTYILAYHNFWQIKDKRNIVYRSAPDYVIKYLIRHGCNLIQSDIRPTNAVLLQGNGYDWPSEIDLYEQEPIDADVPEDGYDIVHFVGKRIKEKGIYRRQKLNEFLKKYYRVATVYEGKVDTTECEFVIVSDPRGCDSQINDVKCPIYYDKTDMWEALTDEVDTPLLAKAKAVFCSSQFIYDNTEHNNKILLENAATYYNYKPIGKENIAVYCGRAENKVDYEYCDKLRKEHPDFRFVSVGVEIPGFEYIPFMGHLKLMDFLAKCKVGLVPLKDNAYTAGQFNLKVWDYIQNKLPVIVTNDYNYKNIKNVHKEWTTEFIEEPIRRWTYVFNSIHSVVSANEVPLVERFVDDRQYRLWWSISKKCNFNCPYCCQRGMQDKYEITNEEVYKVAAKLNELFKKSDYKDIRISILGGEPAVYDLPKLLSIMTKDLGKKLTVLFLTNFSLHDAEWWNSLTKYANIELLASCHTSQLKDIDEWIEKALLLKNITFKAKFVVDDDNFEEVKKWYNYMTSKGLKITLEGCRDSNHKPKFSQEVYEFIKEHDLPAYVMDGKDITQTEAIINFHEKATDCVKCWRRLSIRGSTVVSGCKFSATEFPIFALDELKPLIAICNRAKDCNLCKVNKVFNYERS